MPDRFIILSLPRSGSTTLMRLLNCHPDVRCLGEPFNPDPEDTYLGRVHDVASLDETVAEIWESYNGIKHVWDSDGWPFGRGMTLNLRLTELQGVRVILLARRNHLQRLISYEIADQTKVWAREDRPEANADGTVDLSLPDPASLRRNIYLARAGIELVRNALKINQTSFLELSYEDIYAPNTDLARGGLERVNEILTFLGAGPLPDGAVLERAQRLLDPSLHKVNSKLTYQMIPNIEEIDAICGNDETGHVFNTPARKMPQTT